MPRIEWVKDTPAFQIGTISKIRDEYPTWLDVMHVAAVMKGTARWVDSPPEWAEEITLPLAPLSMRVYFPDYCMERPCEPDMGKGGLIGKCLLVGTPQCGRTRS